MSTTSALTVQAIADMLGIVLSKPTLSQSLAQETEELIQQYIRCASLLATNSRSHRLSCQHINRVLVAESRMNRIFASDHHQRLYGYEFCPVGPYSAIPFEQTEIFLPREIEVRCKRAAEADVAALPVNQSFPFQFLLTEGVMGDKKMLSNRRLIVKAPKPIERSLSAPLGPLQQSAPALELQKFRPVNLMNRVFEKNQLVRDVVPNKLQLFFVKVVDLIRDDMPFKRDSALLYLQTEIGIQQLIPYFLQFIIGNMTLYYKNVGLMENLLKMTKSLINNEHICSDIYVHPFLRIVFSALLGNDYTSIFNGDDSKLREHAAEVLSLLVSKYESSYNGIREVSLNSLIKTLFNPNVSIMAQYGALCGIETIGIRSNSLINKNILPHLKYFSKSLTIEARSLNSRQRQCALFVRDKVSDLIILIESK